jgi:uncharacterized membrane protein
MNKKKWLKVLIAIIITLGIIIRFTNLDLKVYWVDEVINTKYSFGYTEKELGEQVKAWNGRVISNQELQKFQSLNPEKNSIDVIKALAIEEPQSPPLYYLLLRWWTQVFGDSVAIRRSLSACISLLAFPGVYWLCQELFQSSLTGWLAISLVAVSPFHLLYAQEVRYYAAWTVVILFASATFLWAIRRNKIFHWGTYAATLSLGLYTYPLTGLLAIGHGCYVFIINKFRLNKTVINFILAFLAAILTFAPWAFFLFTNSHKISDWRQSKIPLLGLIKAWVINLQIIFWDFHKNSLWEFPFEQPIGIVIYYLLTLLTSILLGYTIYFICRYTPTKIWLFIVIMILLPWLPLIIPDLIKGGIRSTVPRYLIPSYLGIQLSVAYLFTRKISSVSANYKIWQRRLWLFIVCLVFSMGVVSSLTISQSKIWWNKGKNNDNYPIAKIINRSTSPLIIDKLTEDDGRSIMSLSYLLEPKVKLQLVYDESNIPKVAQGFSDMFLVNPSDELKEKLEKEQNFNIELVYQGKRRSLWKLKKAQ